ncbi:predicted protein [Plenodomus lingam JN3]|uniref:Predicted protein n=1 Tax=Leptosphaeria maculans (strain JN3 / isolate v23.1.3 / race Av1-4-5-6-7-8) TaxID=985895 RepID=E4ZTJ1_LEPMJ|nr:predicted protein [Plenodomus lingam JN3]CBX94847.1 predicted protein [Plenodomus lingam JN3]
MRSGFEATTTLPSRLGSPVLSTKEAPDQCTKPAIVGCRFRPVADSVQVRCVVRQLLEHSPFTISRARPMTSASTLNPLE